MGDVAVELRGEGQDLGIVSLLNVKHAARIVLESIREMRAEKSYGQLLPMLLGRHYVVFLILLVVCMHLLNYEMYEFALSDAFWRMRTDILEYGYFSILNFVTSRNVLIIICTIRIIRFINSTVCAGSRTGPAYPKLYRKILATVIVVFGTYYLLTFVYGFLFELAMRKGDVRVSLLAYFYYPRDALLRDKYPIAVPILLEIISTAADLLATVSMCTFYTGLLSYTRRPYMVIPGLIFLMAAATLPGIFLTPIQLFVLNKVQVNPHASLFLNFAWYLIHPLVIYPLFAAFAINFTHQKWFAHLEQQKLPEGAA